MTRAALPFVTAMTIVAAASLVAPANAGTQVNETTGAVLCKGSSSCNKLKANCGGTYTDATDSNGTPYGKCSKSSQIGGQVLVAPAPPPPPGRLGLQAN